MRIRHAMQRDLRALPDGWAQAPGPAGVTFEGVGRGPEELAEAFASAYPPSHPDAIPGWDPVEEEARIMEGRECGPLLPSTRFAVADGRVVGAALLRRACAAARADGDDTLDLQVTNGNPAQRVYEALGFRLVATLTRG